MNITDAIQQRQSTRAFLPDAIPHAQLEKLLNLAGRAPSSSNTQPWQVSVVMGASKTALCEKLLAAQQAVHAPHYDYPYLPADALPHLYLQRKKACGLGLYQTLGITKDDKAAQIQHWQANYRGFDAPVMCLFWLDAALGQGALIDIGGFIQTLALAAHAEGLGTCIQASLAQYPHIVRDTLGIAATQHLICGMSLGYPDPNARINQYRTPRLSVADFVTFYTESLSP